MIDLANIGKYRENNRIEAKLSLGGLPQSIWETYSAFANTLGGVILLGVEERRDKSLHTVDLPAPEKLVAEFWDIINNQKKVSVNILSAKDVTIEAVDGDHIIAIRIPRAQRNDKPVYIGENPMTGSYRRNGEGDYRCTKEEVSAMIRDASYKTQDMLVLEEMGLDVLDKDSIRRYRIRMRAYRPGHVWEELDDNEFLYKLGAAGRGKDGKLHPTAAGLLMFGFEYEIVKEYPHYFLDYQEQLDPNTRWTDRIVSSSGDWSGDLYDFYFRVYNRITQDIRTPFRLTDGNRIDDTPVHNALREALANCLINADYYGRQGIVIVKKPDKITFSNPGEFRIDVETAINGGVSDPRNSAIIKMFNLVDIGERAGSGIPNIYSVWKKQGWSVPEISESFDPERITLSLEVETLDEDEKAEMEEKAAIKTGDKPEINEKPAIKTGDKPKLSEKPAIKTGDKVSNRIIAAQKQAILEYLTRNVSAKSSELAELVGVKSSRIKEILSEMIQEDIVVAEGSNKNRIYKLKS
ncbi:MAG: putative DNA binding domain-containing protein [Oscillospiraceae bacterium]|nr:putative DNA binding domain-containing protein [Oscillospiraceae bacterium]